MPLGWRRYFSPAADAASCGRGNDRVGFQEQRRVFIRCRVLIQIKRQHTILELIS
jgi:hypothetical protein